MDKSETLGPLRGFRRYRNKCALSGPKSSTRLRRGSADDTCLSRKLTTCQMMMGDVGIEKMGERKY